MTSEHPKEYTVKEYAVREKVTERTVWGWLAKGAVKFRKTPGGGIRIVLEDQPLKSTEVSGNPSQ